MENISPPDPKQAEVAWLLRQLNGLASALLSLHEMKEFEFAYGGQNQLIYSYHHDIKPANILVFEHVKGMNPVFKLGDFGAARSHTMSKTQDEMSQQSSHLRGTITYWGPEYSGRKSRPFDIWALACVYLELMIWFILKDELEVFHANRIQSSHTTLGVKNDFYWTRVNESHAELNPAVIKYLETLEDRILGMHVVGPLLAQVLELIIECFQIDPQQRPTATKVCEQLDGLQQAAEILAKNVGNNIQASSTEAQVDTTNLPHRHSDEPEDDHKRSRSPRHNTFPQE